MPSQTDWESAQNGDIKVRNEILLEFQGLIDFCARSLSKGMPSHIDIGDLTSSGQFGLIDAISRFDPHKGWAFETFAVKRIKGAILDELRSQDWVPRSVRSNQRSVDRAMEVVVQEVGGSASVDDVVRMTDLSREDIAKAESNSEQGRVHALDLQLSSDSESGSISLADTLTDDLGDLGSMFENIDPEAVVEAMSLLDEREMKVVAMHYYLGRSLAEIGREFGVTESRVCQIHTKALKLIREGLG
jgi:RNA polymerase sigma factor for flagellar operon FliA